MDDEILTLLSTASTATAAVLGRVGPAEHGRSTPCPEMTVAQVAAHLIGGIRGFTDVGEGRELRFVEDPDAAFDREPPAVAFGAAVDRLLAVFGRAGRISATYPMPWGPTTGGQLLGFELIETVVHGWDVARGLGIELPLSDDVARATLAGARLWVDDSVRVPGMFGPEVSVGDVAPLDQLVAFLGRDPRWAG